MSVVAAVALLASIGLVGSLALAGYFYVQWRERQGILSKQGILLEATASAWTKTRADLDAALKKLAELHEKEHERDYQTVLVDPSAAAAVERLRTVAREARARNGANPGTDLRSPLGASLPGR